MNKMVMEGQKTAKVLDINVEGIRFECVLNTQSKRNPYKLYHSWWDCGKHRKKLAEYANFVSVIEHIRQFCHDKHWGFNDVF